MQNIKLKVKKLRPDAVLPSYAKPGDAGMDIVAVDKSINEKYIEYKTGLAFEVPEGSVCLVFPRSSITKKEVMLKNSVAVLDSGYRGELILRFQKLGEDIYEVGDRIAQIMILPYPPIMIEEVSELPDSDRGEGGFGSTGK